MTKGKIRKCKSCGNEIGSKGKVICPNCGTINKVAVFKRPWFIVIIMLVMIVVFVASCGGEDESDNKDVSTNDNGTVTVTREATDVTVDELIEALDENALKAADTYKGMYVRLTGELSVIDSSGDYFSLAPMHDDYSFDTVLCYINEEHLDKVMEFTSEQEVTVVGEITDVGEFLGYSLEVETIE
jgi:hypothetical protein